MAVIWAACFALSLGVCPGRARSSSAALTPPSAYRRRIWITVASETSRALQTCGLVQP